MIFGNPQYLYLLLLLPALAVIWYWRSSRVPISALAVRLCTILLLILALANPIRVQPQALPGQIVALVDQSDSLGDAGKAELRQQAEQLQREHPGQVKLLYFGANTVAADGEPLRADGSDIAGALQAAKQLAAQPGSRIILLSDGAQTRGDAAQAARALGVPVDTRWYQAPSTPEMWIDSIEVPQTLRVGEEYTIHVLVGSTEDAPAQLTLQEGAQQPATQQIQLVRGTTPITFDARAENPGILQLRAQLSGSPDTYAQNNQDGATALVAPSPRVLLVESSSGGAVLRASLREAGVQADIVSAASLPSRLSDLAPFDAIVLLDVPAGDLTFDQMTALREFVRSEGRGLIATGGRSSFTLGAYKGTPLEEALPVKMDPPPRGQRSAVTLLLMIDHSYSMASATGTSKLDMAKEAAILATESLHEDDRIGVLIFDDREQWSVNFQTLGSGLSLGSIQDRIGEIPIGGGTDILGALQAGLPELAKQPGTVRHAVLLTDGRSFDTTRAPYRDLIAQARAQNITLSAIAIGSDSDTNLLQSLAQWGAGRYHFADTASDIPRLTLLESEIARTEPMVEGEFRAELQTPHPILRDFAPSQLPKLEGYVATTLKPGAEMVLSSPESDPVLSVWQYGLGRAVAWTPSIEAPWADSWSNWSEYGKFWAQLIRYTLPEPDAGSLQIQVAERDGTLALSADAVEPNGAPLDLADTQARITLPDGSERSVALRQTAPGHYTENVALPASGAYAIRVDQTKGDTQNQSSIGYVQHASREYVPGQGGSELLAQISSLSGGRALADLRLEIAEQAEQPSAIGLWFWLLLLALILWPAEIALRRLRR